MPKQMRIFISSTSLDLQEHRQAVFDRIMQSGEYALDMKYFGSQPKDAITACREGIEVADILVGIYAWRYGWVPDGEVRSITEMEFDYARERDIPCLCYVVKEDYPWLPTMMEEGPEKSKLRDFKTKISGLVRTSFTTPDNLAAGVMADLSRERRQFEDRDEPLILLEVDWEKVFEQLALDPEGVRLIQTVNCDRTDHFLQHMSQHYLAHSQEDRNLIYFLSACPLQRPGSLAKRLVYGAGDEFFRFFELADKPGEVYIPTLHIRSDNPQNTWGEFWNLFCRRGLRSGPLAYEDFPGENTPFLQNDTRMACAFIVKENAWNAAKVDIHLNYICRELEKVPPGARRLVVFFILEFSRADLDNHADRHTECNNHLNDLEQLLTDLNAPNQESNLYQHISMLKPAERIDVHNWLREVLETPSAEQVNNTIDNLARQRSIEEIQADNYNMERVEQMQYVAYMVSQR